MPRFHRLGISLAAGAGSFCLFSVLLLSAYPFFNASHIPDPMWMLPCVFLASIVGAIAYRRAARIEAWLDERV